MEKAIKLAAARHDVNLAGETVLNRWEIMGRKIPSQMDLGVAFAVATDITRRVKISGWRIEPAVSRVGKDVLVGFIERNRPLVVSK